MDGTDIESKLESERQTGREAKRTRETDEQTDGKQKVNKQRVRTAERKQTETNRQRSKYAKLD